MFIGRATHFLKTKIRVGCGAVTFRGADICTSNLMPQSSQCACGAQTCLLEGGESQKCRRVPRASIYNQHCPGGLHTLLQHHVALGGASTVRLTPAQKKRVWWKDREKKKR